MIILIYNKTKNKHRQNGVIANEICIFVLNIQTA